MPVWKRDRSKSGRPDDYVVDVEDQFGKRRRFSAKTREKAKLLEKEKILEFQQPAPELDKPDTTLDEYFPRWLAHLPLQEHPLKPATVGSYARLYQSHVSPTLGAMKLQQLRWRHVKELLDAKRRQPIAAASEDALPRRLSKNTTRLIRATLSAMLAEAVDDGLIDVNPAILPRRKRGKKAEVVLRPFEEDELAKMLIAARDKDPEYFPLFLLLARTGLRPGEAFALEWDDIDLPGRKINVERAFSAGVLGTTKTDTVRAVDMSQELAATLAALYRAREAQTLKHGWGEMPELIFINAQRHPLDLSRVRKRFARVLKTAGVGGHRLYDLRHSFASGLLAKGAPITYVSAMLGHADSTTTLRWYARWLPKCGKSYVDGLDSNCVWAPVWHESDNWHRQRTGISRKYR